MKTTTTTDVIPVVQQLPSASSLSSTLSPHTLLGRAPSELAESTFTASYVPSTRVLTEDLTNSPSTVTVEAAKGVPTARPSSYDPRCTAIDRYTTAHLLRSALNPYHSALEHARAASLTAGLPDIAVSPSQGRSLALYARMSLAKNVLEVGTLGGYSAIWFCTASPTLHVMSLEINPHHRSVAESNMSHAGLSERVSILLGDALETLATLASEIKSGKQPLFDFAFIDANKDTCWEYFDMCVGLCRPGAGIYVDNVVRKGRLAREELAKTDASVEGCRRLVENVGKDERVEGVVLQTVGEKNYDGFLIAVKKMMRCFGLGKASELGDD